MKTCLCVCVHYLIINSNMFINYNMLLIHFAENCTIKKTTVEKLCRKHNHLKTRSLDNNYIHDRLMYIVP